jgi:hypothetical protein
VSELRFFAYVRTPPRAAGPSLPAYRLEDRPTEPRARATVVTASVPLVGTRSCERAQSLRGGKLGPQGLPSSPPAVPDPDESPFSSTPATTTNPNSPRALRRSRGPVPWLGALVSFLAAIPTIRSATGFKTHPEARPGMPPQSGAPPRHWASRFSGARFAAGVPGRTLGSRLRSVADYPPGRHITSPRRPRWIASGRSPRVTALELHMT